MRPTRLIVVSFRIAAICLLLFTASDLVRGGESCSERRVVRAGVDQLWAHAADSRSQPGDDCFCCCSHVDVFLPSRGVGFTMLVPAAPPIHPRPLFPYVQVPVPPPRAV